jgi:hypothetical protein
MQNMLNAKYLDIQHGTKLIQDRLQIRYGFSAFLGQNEQPIDMLAAAQRSLQKNMEMNAEPVFQNVFLEWEKVGEQPISSSLVERRDAPA